MRRSNNNDGGDDDEASFGEDGGDIIGDAMASTPLGQLASSEEDEEDESDPALDAFLDVLAGVCAGRSSSGKEEVRLGFEQ